MSSKTANQTVAQEAQKKPRAAEGLLQRKCACGQHTIAGGQCETCGKQRLQLSAGGYAEPAGAPPGINERWRSPNHPLDQQTRSFIGPGFNHDFSRVPTHNDSRSAKSNASISAPWQSGSLFVPERPPSLLQSKSAKSPTHPAERQADRMGAQISRTLKSEAIAPGLLSEEAREVVEPILGVTLKGVYLDVGSNAQAKASDANAFAITEGARVSFAADQFSPTTAQGRALIGHELTHVAQQRAYGQTTMQRFGLALNYEQLAKDIEKAVNGPGTDEEAIYSALAKLQRDTEAVAELEATYSRLFSETLMEALEGDLDNEELDYAKGLMGMPVAAGSKQKIDTATPTTPAQWDALAQRIKDAAEYRTLGIFWGTDEEAIFAVLQPLAGDASKIEAIKQAYARITGGPSTALEDEIKDEMSGSERDYALKLLGVPDPHAKTQAELSRDQLLAVRNELQPGTKVAPPPPVPVGAPLPPLPPPAEWDGRLSDPSHVANRAALKSDLTADLTHHLGCVIPHIRTKAADPKLPVANLEGAANAAVEVTDDEYKSWYSVAATTPGQAALRSGFRFSQAAGNLLDATDPAARAAVGIPLSANDVANWMARNNTPITPTCPVATPGVIEHMAAHNFDPDSVTNGEQAWLQTDVIAPFIAPAARNADLLLYDQFGFALQPQPGKIVLPTTVPGSSLATGGAPNLADRNKMWRTWHIAVHEYIHNLAHPAFERSLSANNEGFTEYFTKGVLTKAAPVAHQNQGLVNKVEGGIFKPETTPALVGPYATPRSYASALAHVENVAKTVPGGDNAVRAAYFQGHTEMLGIDPATRRFATAPPATVDPTMVNVPAGITTLDDLASRSRVPKSEILKANTGLAAAGPLPPKLKLPGVREHRVVTTFLAGGVAGPAETADQIAKQNGVSVEALKRANPSATWATLAGGQLILIPRH
jgi:Domain of unknown function (DUF4157)